MRACARLLMLNACLTCLQIALLFGYDAHNGPAEPADAGFLVELLPEYTGGPRAPLLSVLETFESYSLRTRAQGAAPPRGPCRTHMRPLLPPVMISSGVCTRPAGPAACLSVRFQILTKFWSLWRRLIQRSGLRAQS